MKVISSGYSIPSGWYPAFIESVASLTKYISPTKPLLPNSWFSETTDPKKTGSDRRCGYSRGSDLGGSLFKILLMTSRRKE